MQPKIVRPLLALPALRDLDISATDIRVNDWRTSLPKFSTLEKLTVPWMGVLLFPFLPPTLCCLAIVNTNATPDFRIVAQDLVGALKRGGVPKLDTLVVDFTSGDEARELGFLSVELERACEARGVVIVIESSPGWRLW